jgi:hypothetical protein
MNKNRNERRGGRKLHPPLLSAIGVLVFFGVLMAGVVFGQTDTTGSLNAYSNRSVSAYTGTSVYDITYTLKFRKTARGEITRLSAKVAVPRDALPIQQILDFRTTPGYTEIKFDENGNRIACFETGDFQGTKELTLSFRVRLTGFRVINRGPGGVLPRIFINPEKYIESDNPKIRNTAISLTAGRNGVWDKVWAIYDFVQKNINYTQSWDDLGALYALEKRSGDCSEFSYLMIALCRSLGIPARPVSAFMYDDDPQSQLDNSHQLLEVYIPGIGWIPMDPTNSAGDGQNDVYFAGTPDDTVVWYVTNSSSLLDGDCEYNYWYWFNGNDPMIEADTSITMKRAK